jgi:hypothetical protein
VNTLSQFLVEPRRVQLVAAKHVMRYLKGTMDYGLSYDGDHDFTLIGYTDADWAGSVADRKSTSGCCFSMGSAMISWQSRKQSSIALSTAEAEYIDACSASCEAIWLRKLLTGLFDLKMRETAILCDNQSCRESCVPRQVEAHRDPLSFHPRHGTERSFEAPVH